MNSRKPNFDDDLGELIREALRSHNHPYEPPEAVWRHIEGELKADKTSLPRQKRALLPAPVVQAVFTLLVIIFVTAGLSLRTTSVSDEERPVLVAGLSQSETERYIDEYTVSPIMEIDNDEVELNMLKSYLRAQKSDVDLKYYLAAMRPIDVMPHPMSPEGRLLSARKTKVIFRSENEFLMRPNSRLIH
jgi:hypothetical protein